MWGVIVWDGSSAVARGSKGILPGRLIMSYAFKCARGHLGHQLVWAGGPLRRPCRCSTALTAGEVEGAGCQMWTTTSVWQLSVWADLWGMGHCGQRHMGQRLRQQGVQCGGVWDGLL
jgi:hypothetical protein